MHPSLALAASGIGLSAASPVRRTPLITRENAIDDEYIVMMKKSEVSISMTSSIQNAVGSIAADADVVWNKIGGFAAKLSKADIETLRSDPSVAYLEQNVKASIFATQEDAPWGLARLSNLEPGSTTYTFDEASGQGVCAYVVDTGIDLEHTDFEGRATFVATFVDDIEIDDHGHGSHVAGTIGGRTYGVAKQASLFAIKAFDSQGGGSAASMISGIDAVAEDAPSRDCPNGIVVNMSFGASSVIQSVNDAAAALATAGYFPAVAAGNGNIFSQPIDAGGVSPASEPSVCTVGATDSNDSTASFSNYGEVVDIYAPGVDVLSAAPGGGSTTKSGTSMATPHIAGLAAYFLSLGESASGLCEFLASVALEGVISDVPSGTVNLLAQNGEA